MGALSGGTEMGIAASSLRGRGAGRGPWQMLVMVFGSFWRKFRGSSPELLYKKTLMFIYVIFLLMVI